MQEILLVHYGEIILKGANRPKFERKLVENIRKKLDGEPVKVTRQTGRIVIELTGDADKKHIENQMRRVFGVENFGFGKMIDSDIEVIKKLAVETLGATDGWETFAIRTNRVDKSFPTQSMEVNRIVGDVCGKKFPELSVDLDNPDAEVHIEITPRATYVVGNKSSGLGGLPVGITGKVLCLLSGGIDSPVAAWHLMKRGCDVDFIHFHSIPQTSKSSLSAVRELAEIVSGWQNEAKLFEVPFLDIQNEIAVKANPSYRILLYRRFMLQIAERVAKQNNALTLVTGDSIAQVASQTLENITAVSEAVDMPIIRPLSGMNKQEVVDIARKIGTYETSTIPVDDCCSLFMPSKPITKAETANLKEEQQKLDTEQLISKTLKSVEKREIKNL